MSDFRYDPVFDQWVCIAESRQERPFEFHQTVERRPGIECPFCRGNESLTPPALAEIGNASGDDGWLARAIPNKYPALCGSPPPSPGRESDVERSDGRQEVLVVSPRHVVSFAELTRMEREASMKLFQQRVAVCQADGSVRHVSLFMNCRPLAGASIEHAHFQLIGSPVCTPQVEARVARMRGTSDDRYSWLKELERDSVDIRRTVRDDDDFLVYCPFASRYTGQLRIASRRCRSFHQLESEGLSRLGNLLARHVGGVERVFDQPAHNIVFYFPPVEEKEGPWFVDLIPRFPQAAGFELATDCWINPLSPETAAAKYRDAGAATVDDKPKNSN